MIKDAHELALMRQACEITLRAHRAVFESREEGMTQRQVLLIQDFKPEVICCTPSYAQTLAEVFRQRSHGCPFS